MKKLVYIVLFLTVGLSAQNPPKFKDGINTTFIDTDGYTTAEITAMTDVPDGRKLYDTDTRQWKYYANSVWNVLDGGDASLSIPNRQAVYGNSTGNGVESHENVQIYGSSAWIKLNNGDYTANLYSNRLESRYINDYSALYHDELRHYNTTDGSIYIKPATGYTDGVILSYPALTVNDTIAVRSDLAALSGFDPSINQTITGDWTFDGEATIPHYAVSLDEIAPWGQIQEAIEGVSSTGSIAGNDYVGVFGDTTKATDAWIEIDQALEQIHIVANSFIIENEASLNGGASVPNNAILGFGDVDVYNDENGLVIDYGFQAVTIKKGNTVVAQYTGLSVPDIADNQLFGGVNINNEVLEGVVNDESKPTSAMPRSAIETLINESTGGAIEGITQSGTYAGGDAVLILGSPVGDSSNPNIIIDQSAPNIGINGTMIFLDSPVISGSGGYSATLSADNLTEHTVIDLANLGGTIEGVSSVGSVASNEYVGVFGDTTKATDAWIEIDQALEQIHIVANSFIIENEASLNGGASVPNNAILGFGDVDVYNDENGLVIDYGFQAVTIKKGNTVVAQYTGLSVPDIADNQLFGGVNINNEVLEGVVNDESKPTSAMPRSAIETLINESTGGAIEGITQSGTVCGWRCGSYIR